MDISLCILAIILLTKLWHIVFERCWKAMLDCAIALVRHAEVIAEMERNLVELKNDIKMLEEV